MDFLKAPENAFNTLVSLVGYTQEVRGKKNHQLTGNLLGDAGSRSDVTGTGPFQAVDQTALPNIWKTYRIMFHIRKHHHI